jgi:L-ascorbate metabolism protein UlaG (beta-lactamase superfamily)
VVVVTTGPAWFRWLGVAGIELRVRQRVLLIDPFLTRPPLHRLLSGRVEPNRTLLAEQVQQAEVVLVTHPHWDHLLDVAAIAESTGAFVVGSLNTCRIVAAHGLPSHQIRQVDVGEHLTLGIFHVDVLPGSHGRTPIDWLINGRLPQHMQPPLRLRDYRMDQCFSFRIEADGLRLLDCPAVCVAADVLTVGTDVPLATLERLLGRVCPRVVIPVHWDNLFRPLAKGVRPILGPPATWLPPFRRMDPREFARLVARLAPDTRVLVPTALERYDLQAWCERATHAPP